MYTITCLTSKSSVKILNDGKNQKKGMHEYSFWSHVTLDSLDIFLLLQGHALNLLEDSDALMRGRILFI